MGGTFKGWIPEHYLDETVPGCRAKPDDWLIRRGDVLMIDHCDEDGEPIAAEEPTIVVKEGDQLGFCGLTTFDPVRVKLVGPGPADYETLTPVPPEATCFWLEGDMDTFATSLDDFVKEAMGWSLEIGETVDVDCYDWSETTFVLRGGAFVEVAAAPAETRQ